MNHWAPRMLLLAALGSGAAAQAGEFEGLELAQALDRLEARGLSVLYSSDLVKPGMVVATEPVATEPRAMLAEIVRPFGLAPVDGPGGSVLLVRPAGAVETGTPAATDPAGVLRTPAAPQVVVDEIVVSASRYRLYLGSPASSTVLTSSDIELLPTLGEDPLRSLERLPGVARQDFTSKPNVRGGVADETLVRFDGVRLYNPFHLKEFQSPFSAVDPGIVSGLTVYTAGFPVIYGDRMGSVVDIAPLAATADLQGRVAASVFNAGARLNGSYDGGRGRWLASARRGNLDMVLELADPDLGDPEYSDYHARLDHDLGDFATLSASVLVFDDDLHVFDRDQEEEAVARFRDEYVWLRADLGDGEVGGRLQAVRTRIESERSGTADLPGVTTGSLEDRRSFTVDSLQAEGWWATGTQSTIQAGAEWRGSSGQYHYRDEATFALLFMTPGAPQEPARTRELVVRPDGDEYAAYVNWRVAPSASVTVDAGLRWAYQSLAGASDDQLAPRIGALWRPREDTRLRAGWGRYFQSQGVTELQVSDGEMRVFPAQRAEHWVLSAEHMLVSGIGVRFEAYRKEYQHLRPRFENLLDTLVVLPELRPDRVRIEPDAATADGAELALTYGADGPLSAWMNYGWSSVEDRVAGVRVRRAWDQTHSLGAGVSYRDSRWEWSVAATWRSGWPTTAVELATLEPFPLVAVGRRGADRIGTYARLDARVARRFAFESGRSLSVFLDLSNVTNRRNDCCIEYQIEDEAGETFLDVGRRESLMLVPNVGVVWEF